MKAFRSAAISLMAAIFICSATHAQEGPRAANTVGMQLDSTVVEEPDGSITVYYFQNAVPEIDPKSVPVPDKYGEAYRRNPPEDRPGRSVPAVTSGPKDATASVGVIPLTSSVSQTGGRIYSIDIPVAADCPFPPSVSLVYNSQAGNGEAGYGWSVGGLSSITVRNRIGAYEGYSAHCLYDSADALYSLDGTPLMVRTYAGMYDCQLQTISGYVFVKAHI